MKRPIEYAKQSCDTMMRTYEAAKLPPVGHFHYHQGVFLSGVLHTYALCGEQKYEDYAKAWVDSVIGKDGSIAGFEEGSLDDLQPGILLLELYEKYGESQYKLALDTLIGRVRNWKTNALGGFWHKGHLPNEMWLDGLYMAGPVIAEYAKKNDMPELWDIVVKQAFLMHEHMTDSKTGLMYHAWSCDKAAEWANPETGLSPEFWGRAMGWYVVAILDILEFLPEGHTAVPHLIEIEQQMLQALVQFQDKETGLWYQVVDKGATAGNWPEISCSSLYVYALSKAVRMGVMNASYLRYVKKGYEGVIGALEFDGDDLHVVGVCIGTGVCDYQGYIERPTSCNDLHGVGAFLLMCADVEKNFDLL